MDCGEACSTCLNPEFPNWMWRYNRNKHLAKFEPWMMRAERLPPNYRNMGVKDSFRFHPIGENESCQPLIYVGLNYCHDLKSNRQSGFGNSALGLPPGPAPPKAIVYAVGKAPAGDELYKINEICGMSEGISLLNGTSLSPLDDLLPMNPRQYLEETLNQVQEIPGTFPHFNVKLPSKRGECPKRYCPNQTSVASIDLYKIWTEGYKRQLQRHAYEECVSNRRSFLPGMECESASLPPWTNNSETRCTNIRRKIY